MDLVSLLYIWIFNFPPNVWWRGCLFSKVYFWQLCQESVNCRGVGLSLGFLFYSIGLCVYILLPYCFCYYKTLKYNLKSGVVIPPVLFFFFLRIDLAIQGLLCFHINFMIVFSSSVKDVIGIFMEIALNL
jgi:hypothetical protein